MPRTGESDGQTTGTSPCGLTIGSMILWSWGIASLQEELRVEVTVTESTDGEHAAV